MVLNSLFNADMPWENNIVAHSLRYLNNTIVMFQR